jgi:uncharacterized protein YciI
MDRPALHVVKLTTIDVMRHEEHLAEHKEWVRKHADAGAFLYGGSFENRSEGGMIIARTESRAALDTILREDPFLVHGAVMHEVTTFNVSLGCQAHTLV